MKAFALCVVLAFLALAGCASLQPPVEVSSTRPVQRSGACAERSESGSYSVGNLTIINRQSKALTPQPIVYRDGGRETYRQQTNFTVFGFLTTGVLVKSCLQTPQNISADGSMVVQYAFPLPSRNLSLLGQPVATVALVEFALDGNYRQIAHTVVPSDDPGATTSAT